MNARQTSSVQKRARWEECNSIDFAISDNARRRKIERTIGQIWGYRRPSAAPGPYSIAPMSRWRFCKTCHRLGFDAERVGTRGFVAIRLEFVVCANGDPTSRSIRCGQLESAFG